MFRLLGAVVFTMAAVVFSMANTQQVELDFVFGPPAKVRLIFLLMMAFVLGLLVATFVSMMGRIRLRSKLRAVLEHQPQDGQPRK